ncbi:MAG: sigma-70 family RNA polymerase sigma factor [Planctomycetes bacterium]|nr:sigma-70 family RNA polymerase sigma factor [Planctomycetota bacterium]
MVEINDLIKAAKEGEREAFGLIVGEYQGMVRGYIALQIFDTDQVFDLAQETFISAYTSLSSFSGDDFGGWLRGIARNLCLQHIRTEARRKNREKSAMEKLFLQRQEDYDEIGPQRLDRLQGCLQRLKEQQKNSYEAICLHYFKGRSTEDIAQETGRNSSSTRVLLMRARIALRACLERALAT